MSVTQTLLLLRKFQGSGELSAGAGNADQVCSLSPHSCLLRKLSAGEGPCWAPRPETAKCALRKGWQCTRFPMTGTSCPRKLPLPNFPDASR